MKEIYVKPEVTSEVLEPGALAFNKGSPIIVIQLAPETICDSCAPG